MSTACGLRQRGFVAECTRDEMPDRACGRVGRRIEKAEVQAERDAGEPEHAAQLAPAEHRNRCH